MINGERKERFTSEYYNGDSIKHSYILISRVSDNEDRLGKDLCDFSFDEILEMYAKLQNGMNTLISINTVLEKYTNWCIERGFASENAYEKVTINILMGVCKDTSVYTLAQLQDIAAKYENPVDRVLVLAPFFGFTTKRNAEDYASLEPSDINVSDCVIHLPTREITATDTFCDLLLECFRTYRYSWEPGNNGYDMIGSGLIKARRGSEVDVPELIRQKYARRFKQDTPDISYNKVIDSGVIHYCKLFIRENNIKNSEQLWGSEKFKSDILVRFDIKSIRKNVFYSRYMALLFSNEP